MTNYQKCKMIRRAILNRAAEVMTYTWSADLAVREMRDIPSNLSRLGTVDITKLTAPQMEDLGFLLWSEDNPIRLIPLWLVKFLPDMVECESIDGEKSVPANMDNDNRFGCVAYGLRPSAEEELP